MSIAVDSHRRTQTLPPSRPAASLVARGRDGDINPLDRLYVERSQGHGKARNLTRIS